MSLLNIAAYRDQLGADSIEFSSIKTALQMATSGNTAVASQIIQNLLVSEDIKNSVLASIQGGASPFTKTLQNNAALQVKNNQTTPATLVSSKNTSVTGAQASQQITAVSDRQQAGFTQSVLPKTANTQDQQADQKPVTTTQQAQVGFVAQSDGPSEAILPPKMFDLEGALASNIDTLVSTIDLQKKKASGDVSSAMQNVFAAYAGAPDLVKTKKQVAQQMSMPKNITVPVPTQTQKTPAVDDIASAFKEINPRIEPQKVVVSSFAKVERQAKQEQTGGSIKAVTHSVEKPKKQALSWVGHVVKDEQQAVSPEEEVSQTRGTSKAESFKKDKKVVSSDQGDSKIALANAQQKTKYKESGELRLGAQFRKTKAETHWVNTTSNTPTSTEGVMSQEALSYFVDNSKKALVRTPSAPLANNTSDAKSRLKAMLDKKAVTKKLKTTNTKEQEEVEKKSFQNTGSSGMQSAALPQKSTSDVFAQIGASPKEPGLVAKKSLEKLFKSVTNQEEAREKAANAPMSGHVIRSHQTQYAPSKFAMKRDQMIKNQQIMGVQKYFDHVEQYLKKAYKMKDEAVIKSAIRQFESLKKRYPEYQKGRSEHIDVISAFILQNQPKKENEPKSLKEAVLGTITVKPGMSITGQHAKYIIESIRIPANKKTEQANTMADAIFSFKNSNDVSKKYDITAPLLKAALENNDLNADEFFAQLVV